MTKGVELNSEASRSIFRALAMRSSEDKTPLPLSAVVGLVGGVAEPKPR